MCLPPTSTRITSHAATAADLQHSLKELRVENRNEESVLRGKTGMTGLQMFSGADFMSPFLYLIISRKALKSFMVMTVPRDVS